MALRPAAWRRAVLAVTAWVAWAGCGERPGNHSDTVAAAKPAPAAGAPADTSCPKTGQWQLCSVRDRLERAGLVLVPRDSVRQPFLSVPGAVYGVGTGEIQVYLYPDSLARQRDFAKVDSATLQPAGTTITWDATPNLIASNNLAAILLSDSETQIERVELALTAGLPEK